MRRTAIDPVTWEQAALGKAALDHGVADVEPDDGPHDGHTRVGEEEPCDRGVGDDAPVREHVRGSQRFVTGPSSGNEPAPGRSTGFFFLTSGFFALRLAAFSRARDPVLRDIRRLPQSQYACQ